MSKLAPAMPSSTAEVAVQHFALTDEECFGYNTNAKMYPPLRSADHVKAVIEAIKDDTIDAFTTDHAPHTEPEKLEPFQHAAFGHDNSLHGPLTINKCEPNPRRGPVHLDRKPVPDDARRVQAFLSLRQRRLGIGQRHMLLVRWTKQL